ncbi:EEPD1 protein, partial [Polypterus senegalus]
MRKFPRKFFNYCRMSVSTFDCLLQLVQCHIARRSTNMRLGHWDVVREGLTNPWIPDNWSWGGVASDHCPVFAEFYINPVKKETVPNGNGVTVMEHTEANPKHER